MEGRLAVVGGRTKPMNGYITTQRFGTSLDVPISLPQTELRRGRYINCGQVRLTLGQTMRVRCLNLHLVSILTATAVPNSFSAALGLVSAGIYMSPMMCSSACLLTAKSPGIVSLNSFAYKDFSTPGVYYFTISNNTTNIDVSVALTGVVKLLNYD
jgi:hypothetical protein